MANVAQSSHLQTYDYNVETGTLLITFHTNGTTYRYDKVAPQDFQAMISAGGGGTTFWSEIRRRYAGVKIAGPNTGGGNP